MPCEGGTPPMTREEVDTYIREVNGWEIEEVANGVLRIKKRFKFEKYLEGIDFVDKIAKLAEGEGHHPDLEVGYAKVVVNLWTHAVGGLSENDFIMAAKIDKLLD